MAILFKKKKGENAIQWRKESLSTHGAKQLETHKQKTVILSHALYKSQL